MPLLWLTQFLSILLFSDNLQNTSEPGYKGDIHCMKSRDILTRTRFNLTSVYLPNICKRPFFIVIQNSNNFERKRILRIVFFRAPLSKQTMSATPEELYGCTSSSNKTRETVKYILFLPLFLQSYGPFPSFVTPALHIWLKQLIAFRTSGLL